MNEYAMSIYLKYISFFLLLFIRQVFNLNVRTTVFNNIFNDIGQQDVHSYLSNCSSLRGIILSHLLRGSLIHYVQSLYDKLSLFNNNN